MIGFESSENEWSGPISFEFKHFSDHNNVVRYRHELTDGAFSLYLLRSLLDVANDRAVPRLINVTMAASPWPPRRIGFMSDRHPLEVRTSMAEVEFLDEQVNTKRYIGVLPDSQFRPYVPNSIFGSLTNPRRISFVFDWIH